jgi:phytoene dehydrogenase-like protein
MKKKIIIIGAGIGGLTAVNLGDRAEDLKLKNRMRDTLIRRASQVIPDLPDLIEFKDTATPLTFERYTQNFEGSTNAWSWIPQKNFMVIRYRVM